MSEVHQFDPGHTGMSKHCNELVLRDGSADECGAPRIHLSHGLDPWCDICNPHSANADRFCKGHAPATSEQVDVVKRLQAVVDEAFGFPYLEVETTDVLALVDEVEQLRADAADWRRVTERAWERVEAPVSHERRLCEPMPARDPAGGSERVLADEDDDIDWGINNG